MNNTEIENTSMKATLNLYNHLSQSKTIQVFQEYSPIPSRAEKKLIT